MQALGLDVFVDLKLHDIPTTVHRTARVLGSLGIGYLTFHAHGGVDMLRAGVTAPREGADAAGVERPRALAVTVLTSDDTAPAHVLAKRVETAVDAGCTGLMCAVADVAAARAQMPSLFIAATGHPRRGRLEPRPAAGGHARRGLRRRRRPAGPRAAPSPRPLIRSPPRRHWSTRPCRDRRGVDGSWCPLV